MSTKHFINDPSHLVNSALRGVTLANPLVALDMENKIIYRRPRQPDQTTINVSIISGGGSGHEPSFSGFVGRGLLTAAVSGTIFASPGAEQVRRCILGRVETRKGVLVVVMNYTGDVLNFGRAQQKARAGGVDCDMVIVGDDVGVGRKQGGKVGRRGIAGTVLVLKIAGALAEEGATLHEVHHCAQLVADNIVSIGASLSHVHVPGRSVNEDGGDDLEAAEVEIGMGIHNEPGSERRTEDLQGLIRLMLVHLLDPNDPDRNFLSITEQDQVVLLVNNLGGVSVLEMGGILSEVCEQLQRTYRIVPKRTIAGTFMTSLNGLGFSVTLLRVRDTTLGEGKGMLDLLDVSAEAPGWSVAIQKGTWDNPPTGLRDEDPDQVATGKSSNLQLDPARVRKAMNSALNRVIAAEPDITHFDTIVGDGDCGIGLARGATGIHKLLEKSQNETIGDAVLLLNAIIRVVEDTMDGTSGALYAIYLNALAAALAKISSKERTLRQTKISDWASGLQEASRALEKYTPARPGDRTLVDALQPFVKELKSSGDIAKAAASAQEGAARTKGMQASLGRTVYVGGEGTAKVPDPGAHGLSVFLAGLAEGAAE